MSQKKIEQKPKGDAAKVTDKMRERSRKLKEEERAVVQIAQRMNTVYLRNVYDAFRQFPHDPKRLIVKAYRRVFRDDERRMKELEDTHPSK